MMNAFAAVVSFDLDHDQDDRVHTPGALLARIYNHGWFNISEASLLHAA